MKKDLKAGEFRMKANTEELVWRDRKRVTIFALPISFTVYGLTQTRIKIKTGLLNTKEEEVMLFRVRDVSLTQNLIERIGNTGTVIVTSTDATSPNTALKHVKNAQDVKELLVQLVEENRKKNRVRAAEVMDVDASDEIDGMGDEDQLIP